MPKEFVDKYKNKYEEFVLDYNAANQKVKMYTDNNFFKKIINFFKRNTSDKRELLPDNEDVTKIKNKNIEVSQY
jgi:hypothetical protein